MKKLLILAAMASAALVSCVKNEPAPSVTDRQEITFAPPVVGVTTKSVDLVTTANIAGAFSVYGYYHSGDYAGFNAEDTYTYMENVEVTKDDDFYSAENQTYASWITDDNNDYYWPKTGKMTFVAYYPSLKNTTDQTSDYYVNHTEAGIQFKNYVVDEKADVDLMFSDRAYNKVKSDEKLNISQYYGVELVFKHALSAIRFKFKAASELVDNNGGPKYTFVVEEVKLLNVHSKGDFNQGLNESDNINAPTGEAATKDWNTSTAREYTAYTKGNGEGLSIDSETLVESYDVANNKTNGANLILLPQSLNHDGADGNVTVQVTYKLRHDKMEEGHWIAGNTVQAELSTNNVDNWLRGYIYTYNLTLSLDKIEFAPSVIEWVDFDSDSSTADVTDPIDVTVPDQAS